MEKKIWIRDTAGILLGCIVTIYSAWEFSSEYLMAFHFSSYRPFYERLRNLESLTLPGMVVGILLLIASIRDLLGQRHCSLLQSIISGRDFIQIKELAKEGKCSVKKTRKLVKAMIKKNRLPGAFLDHYENLLILDKAVQEDYLENFKKWQKQQAAYETAGISLTQQEFLLEGKKHLESLEMLSKEIQDFKIRRLLKEFSKDCLEKLLCIEELKNHMPQAENLCKIQLPQLEEIVQQYLDMESLNPDGVDDSVKKKLEEFLSEYT